MTLADFIRTERLVYFKDAPQHARDFYALTPDDECPTAFYTYLDGAYWIAFWGSGQCQVQTEQEEYTGTLAGKDGALRFLWDYLVASAAV